MFTTVYYRLAKIDVNIPREDVEALHDHLESIKNNVPERVKLENGGYADIELKPEIVPEETQLIRTLMSASVYCSNILKMSSMPWQELELQRVKKLNVELF